MGTSDVVMDITSIGICAGSGVCALVGRALGVEVCALVGRALGVEVEGTSPIGMETEGALGFEAKIFRPDKNGASQHLSPDSSKERERELSITTAVEVRATT